MAVAFINGPRPAAAQCARRGAGFGGGGSALFGGQSGNSGLFGTATATGGGGGGGGAAANDALLEQLFGELDQAYKRDSPWYRFRFMLYNLVEHARDYQKPADVHPVLWQQAVAQNPDPTRLVPVEAKGFQDLKERIDVQDASTAEHEARLDEIEQVLRSLKQRHAVSTLSKLEQYGKRHQALKRRLVALERRLELMAARGRSVGADEEAFASHTATLLARLTRPDQFNGRLAQLAADARMRAPADDSTLAEFQALPPETLDDLGSALRQMTTGIKALNETLLQDMKDLEVIDRGLADIARKT